MNEFKKNFIAGLQNNKPQLLTKNLIGDVETPISCLLKIKKNQKYSFLLESVEGGSLRGRYSLLGCDPDLVWKVENNSASIKYNYENYKYKISDQPIESLKNLIEFSKFDKGKIDVPYPILVGYLGYPMIKYMEKILLKNKDNINIPDSVLIRPKIVSVFDNIKDTITVMTVVYPSEKKDYENAYNDAQELLELKVSQLKENLIQKPASKIKSKLKFVSNYSKEEYFYIISKAKEYIKNGDIFQVVTSQRFETKYDLEAVSLYRSLRRLNPSPYLVNLNFGEIGLVASSPELLVQLRNKKITIRPIAGTRKRGINANEDLELSKDLLNDQKELAEHLMLLDLGRNDVGRVAKNKTVKVTEKMIIEYYSHVMHIVSNVEGSIDDKYDAVDALKAGFPAGTVSGAPKIRAMQIIEELENLNRSFYAGCMGYFDSSGDMDTCISLRCGLVQNGKLHIQAGGGVVYDSNPEDEYQETINKASAIMAAAEDSYKYNS
ncbi:anthranilate synthase component I [Pelagibacterales bacterium SAG-MED31]|nr:anthranilate synthase component I [Pelagibacterales bacterium SAG-MED31]